MKLVLTMILVVAVMLGAESSYASDFVGSQSGSIGNCQISAQNRITENMRTASATTNISGAQYGTAVSVSATFYFIGVSGEDVGVSGSYRGGSDGQYGAVFSKNVPNENYRFYRAESSHYASYQGTSFTVPSIVTHIP